ncbi:restriction endonuclease subunit S [Phyllobacterium zundukense]|uniref:Restriction endonuclease subunit S n=1 Tax=Phyllobacterium zundukense TaxID=1867719 RepID=A0ACD4CV48_9HYPH|nr:restriction endonuclease subunit S [Phyllobacterium zundukense]UXN57465.1 restriction endonuclease subunit S [Phyllobacterium zundukense]
MSALFSDGWKNIVLGDHAEFRNGVNFTAKSAGKVVKVLGVSDFASRSIISDFQQMPSVTLANTPNADDYLRDGDFVFVRSNGSRDLIGRCAMVLPRNEKVMFSGFTIRMRLVSTEILPRFWLNFVKSELFKKALHERGSGSYITNLSQETLSKIDVWLPPPEEQQRIVDILDSWDQAIDQTERLIGAKQRRFDAARIRLIETFQSADKGNNLWAPAEFSEIAEELKLRNTAGHGPDRVMGVIKGEGLVPMRSHVMAADLRRYLIVPPRAIAYNPMRLNIGSIAASRYDQDVLVSPDYVVFRARKDRADPDFLRFLIGTKRWRDHLVIVGSGSVRTRIYFDGLAEMVLRVPDIREQKRIGQFLTAVEQDLNATKESASGLRTQKRGLMQKLLTGEWRLDERFDPEALTPPLLKVGGRS